MANDLIPPPSPAGRPLPSGSSQPSGGPPRLIELPPEPPRVDGLEPFAPPTAAVKLPPSKFRNRFGFLLGALAGALVAAVIVLVAVLVSGDNEGAADEGLAANWSAWQPPDHSIADGPREIGEWIGAQYAHPDGKQMVLVTGGPMPAPVALRPSAGPIEIIQDNGVLYQLNGLGPNNSIKGGTPSADRLKLMKREALELALYTFRYVPDAEMVVAMLPPPPPTAAETAAAAAAAANAAANGGQLSNAATPSVPRAAIFFRPGDLKAQLQVPLGDTLPPRVPTGTTLDPGEEGTVELLTKSNVFEWSIQESTGLLVLDRAP